MEARSVPEFLQGMNKVSTAVQMRFDVRNTSVLAPQVKARLVKLAGSRMTDEGVLILEAKRHRTQEQNRVDAIMRLTVLIQKALDEPRVRHATRPSLGAKAERVKSKKKRGEAKYSRHIHTSDFD